MKKKLQECTIAELKRRKTKSPPKPVKDIDFGRVIKMCKARITDTAAGLTHDDDDFEHYLYEDVMKAIFGDDIFDWINAQEGER